MSVFPTPQRRLLLLLVCPAWRGEEGKPQNKEHRGSVKERRSAEKAQPRRNRPGLRPKGGDGARWNYCWLCHRTYVDNGTEKRVLWKMTWCPRRRTHRDGESHSFQNRVWGWVSCTKHRWEIWNLSSLRESISCWTLLLFCRSSSSSWRSYYAVITVTSLIDLVSGLVWEPGWKPPF